MTPERFPDLSGKQDREHSEFADQLRTFALDQIALQNDRDAILAQLSKMAGADVAEQIYDHAMQDYEALKVSGKLSDYEYELHFSRAKNPLTPTERLGLIFMGVGVAGTVVAILSVMFLEPDYAKFISLLVLTAALIPTGFMMFMLGREADKSESGRLFFRFISGKSLFSLGDVVKRLRRGRL